MGKGVTSEASIYYWVNSYVWAGSKSAGGWPSRILHSFVDSKSARKNVTIRR